MSAGAHIQVLPDEVANKIAAGEVVDRPASVLKELVENAVDAGATELDVEIVGGGRTAIVVSDNGSGMSRDDAILSVERHATSKIREVEDIERIQTLGFRGEALAAISSVSRFSLTTRRHDAQAGTELLISGGKMQDVREAGCPPGTSVAIRNLFFNVPARRKFLRSESTELAHLRQVLLMYALCHPEIGLRLRVDEREVYRLPAGAKLDERLRELFGPDIMASLRPLSLRTAEVRITGYVSLPQTTRGDRSEQYVFINGRPAGASAVNFAIGEAYQTLIPKGRFPVVFLFIDMDASLVDVNVHPTKKEVRLRHPSEVRDAIIRAIREAVALGSASSSPAVRELLDAAHASPTIQMPDLPTLPAFHYPRHSLTPPDARPSASPASPPISLAEPAQAGAAKAPWSWCRILGQVGGLYVILETEDGFILMDPHAAHERILYERFMKQLVAREVRSQGLLAAESVALSPAQALIVEQNLDLLRQMGFGISDFGGDTFLVDALPLCLANASAPSVLLEVAQDLDRGGERSGTEKWAVDRIASAACKAAVKAQDRLTRQEIENLVLDLARAEMPYTCPHGRPTIIFMSFQELARKFGRE
jgi:DNA mismatch repair protein MutL